MTVALNNGRGVLLPLLALVGGIAFDLDAAQLGQGSGVILIVSLAVAVVIVLAAVQILTPIRSGLLRVGITMLSVALLLLALIDAVDQLMFPPTCTSGGKYIECQPTADLGLWVAIFCFLCCSGLATYFWRESSRSTT